MKKVITRNFHLADGDLKQSADALAATITRDIADFAPRNVTVTTVNNLKTLTTNFDNHSTDEELLGELTAATVDKNTFANNIRISIRPIRNMAENVYGNEGKYKSFGFTDMDGMDDADLYRLAKRVVRMGTKYLAELAGEGLTAAQLAALGTLATSLDLGLDKIEDAIENRDIETQERIKKGNILWAEMMRLTGIGKSIFQDINEAKYNDYVLTESGGTAGTPPVTPP